jgi:hypothetical protein
MDDRRPGLAGCYAGLWRTGQVEAGNCLCLSFVPLS